MSGYGPLLATLFALLIGLIVGKAWERYKLREGRWIDRRRSRESPHYVLGLDFLVGRQLDQAIEELSRAGSIDPEALEIQMVLGNAYREKGQVGRAITIHQNLLQRPKLSKLEHAYVLVCLGLDYRRGGFVDRALEAFQEVRRLDPHNREALTQVQRLYEEQHQWDEAARVRQQIASLPNEDPGRNQAILAYIENEIGMQHLRQQEVGPAARRFESAIDLDKAAVPAYINLGDVRAREGRMDQAIAQWECAVRVAPERAYLVFDRLEQAYAKADAPAKFQAFCRRLIDANPQDWRARLALARHLAAAGAVRPSLDLLLDALPFNPHGLSIHQEIWHVLTRLHLDPALVQRYVDLTRDAVFYLDPHVCTRCRYRSTELLWQCPQCHEWNTFVEERIAPAEGLET